MITPVRQPLHRTAKDADRKDVPLACSSRQADIKADESKTWKASQPGPHRTARPHGCGKNCGPVDQRDRASRRGEPGLGCQGAGLGRMPANSGQPGQRYPPPHLLCAPPAVAPARAFGTESSQKFTVFSRWEALYAIAEASGLWSRSGRRAGPRQRRVVDGAVFAGARPELRVVAEPVVGWPASRLRSRYRKFT